MAKAQYIGVSGVARKVKQPYVGVSGVARKCKSGYIGMEGVARKFFPGVAPGTQYILHDSGTFYPEETGYYDIEMHGGGGGGGGYASSRSNNEPGILQADGGIGGSSGKTFTITLSSGTGYSYSVGAAGKAGRNRSGYGEVRGGDGSPGGDTTFGNLSIPGGRGGEGGLADREFGSTATGRDGASHGNASGNYGAGGAPGKSGGPGIIIITKI